MTRIEHVELAGQLKCEQSTHADGQDRDQNADADREGRILEQLVGGGELGEYLDGDTKPQPEGDDPACHGDAENDGSPTMGRTGAQCHDLL